MTFARTRDFTLVKSVLTHPTQARMSADDATDLANWAPNEDERVIYLAVTDETDCVALRDLIGIITLIPQNAVCFEIHAALLPCAWGLRTRLALTGAISWAFRETPARRIVGSIPEYNKLAIRLARDCGMRAYGRNRASWLRGGKLWDQILLGID